MASSPTISSFEDERRAALVALLASHEPHDEEERADRERMLRYAREVGRPFSADEESAHFTASALVLDASLTRTCLVHHRKLDRWLQPGGHIDPDDASPLAAALREVAEETALVCRPALERPLDIDIHRFPARGSRSAHLHLDIRFLLVIDDVAALRRSDEAHEVRWFSFADARSAADPGLRRMLDKAERLAETIERPG